MNYTYYSTLYMERLHRLRTLFYLVTPQETLFESVGDVPDYVDQATVFFLLLYAVEYVYLRAVQKSSNARINEALASISCGLLMRTTLLLYGNFDQVAYIWIYKHFSLISCCSLNSAWIWWVCFIGMDFAYYWMHRCSHEINFIWASHQVHHSSEDYNLGTALRQSVFQHFFSWTFYLPMAFFIPPQVFLVHWQFNLLYQFWIHTEVIRKLGPLEWFLNTPSHHRVHHGRNRYCIDKNYGGTLIVWDRMFGTFEAEEDVVVYGLVHPLQSFNPIYTQLCHFLYIWNQFCQSATWSEGLSVLFKGPGWSPGKPRLGLSEDIPNVELPIEKYGHDISTMLTGYLFFHLLVTVICYQECYARQMGLNIFAVSGFMLYILLSLTAIGSTCDKKWYAPFLHLWCSVVFILGHGFVGPPTFIEIPYNLWLFQALQLYFLISVMFWCFKCYLDFKMYKIKKYE